MAAGLRPQRRARRPAAAGRIPDPYIGDQLAAGAWADSRDWWYRCRLDVPSTPTNAPFVAFAGVDYDSAVYACAVCLGRHTGMFSPQTYELTPHLRQTPDLSWPAHLGLGVSAALVLHAGAAPGWTAGPRPGPRKSLTLDRFATLKMPMSYGWDFAPLLTMGIGDYVTLKLSGPAAILDLWPAVEWPAGDLAAGRLLSVALAVEIDSAAAMDGLLDVSVQESHSCDPFPTTETQSPKSGTSEGSLRPLRLCGVFPGPGGLAACVHVPHHY